jgi:hypothetical protein
MPRGRIKLDEYRKTKQSLLQKLLLLYGVLRKMPLLFLQRKIGAMYETAKACKQQRPMHIVQAQTAPKNNGYPRTHRQCYCGSERNRKNLTNKRSLNSAATSAIS